MAFANYVWLLVIFISIQILLPQLHLYIFFVFRTKSYVKNVPQNFHVLCNKVNKSWCSKMRYYSQKSRNVLILLSTSSLQHQFQFQTKPTILYQIIWLLHQPRILLLVVIPYSWQIWVITRQKQSYETFLNRKILYFILLVITKFLIFNFLPFSFDPLENITRPLVFWCFQGE